MTHTPPSLRPCDGSVHHLPLTGGVCRPSAGSSGTCLPACLSHLPPVCPPPRERSCPRARGEAGARRPEPATPALGWSGAARRLDGRPGRDVPPHLHSEQDRGGHPGAHLPGGGVLGMSRMRARSSGIKRPELIPDRSGGAKVQFNRLCC